MAEPGMSQIKQIKHSREQAEVNAHLAVGWVLVGMTPGTTEDGTAWPLYTLGWPQDGEPASAGKWWMPT